MAQFDALRDAFNGFNNMLLDSQQWDEKHKAREADREYKHTILRGDMMQREFQNNMAKNDYKLRERGEDRLADSLQFTQKMQLEDQKMRIAADGRDQKKAAATLRQMEQELVTGSVAAAEAEKMTDPSAPFDVNGLLSPEQLQNPSIMENLNKHTGQQYGFLVGEDGIGRNADEKGTPFTMAKIDQKDLEPYILGLVETYDDKFGNALDQKLQLTETIKTAKATAKSSDSIYTGQQRGMANAQKNRAEAELRKVNQFFSPRGQMQFQQQEIANLTGIAGWNRERNNESAARAAEAKALRHMDALEALRKGITNPVTGGKDTDIWATELKDDGSAQWLGKANYKDNVFTWAEGEQLAQGIALPEGVQAVKPTERIYKPNESAGSGDDIKMASHIMKGFENVRKTITPQLSLVKAGAGENAAAEQGQTFYNEIVNAEEPVMRNGKPVLNEDGTPKMRSLAPKNGPEVIQAQKEAERMLIKAHNMFADMYMKAEAIYSKPNTFGGGRTVTEDMQTWIDTVYLPKLEEAGFAYQPVEKYRYQVRGTD